MNLIKDSVLQHNGLKDIPENVKLTIKPVDLKKLDGFNFKTACNRYQDPNQALSFQNVYLSIPPGDYFDGDFSVSAWVNLTSNKQFNVLVSFANKGGIDLIWIGFKNLYFYVEISSGSRSDPNAVVTMSSNDPLQMNDWTKVTFTLKDTIGSMYFKDVFNNGGVKLVQPRKVNRNLNFIGQDYQNGSLYLAEAVYEDLTIFKGALTLNDIKKELLYNGE